MSWGEIGATLGAIGWLGVIGFAVSEIALSVRDARRRPKIEAQERLKAKIDAFTCRYGERSEDPDDQPYERTGS